DSRNKFKKSATGTQKDLKAVGGAFKTFAAAAVVSIGAVSVAVVKMGADFEKQMAIVGGVSRASEEDLIRLEKAARESGATTEKTAKQSAEAMQFLAMAGLEANEIIAALPGVINLSTAANIDLAASADIATNVLAGMGLQVSDLARVNDTLVAASTRANTNVLELGEAFKYVAPVAKAVNLSLEDTSAILGTLANSGVKASDAGTDLRQALVRTGKVAKQLGMDEGSTLIDVLKRIKEEQWGVTEVTKAFGLIATKSVLILKDNIDEYEKLAVSIKGASGEAEELADKIRDTLSVQFTTMVSALQEAGLQIFDIFKDDLKDIVKMLTEAIKGTYGLIAALKKLKESGDLSKGFNLATSAIPGITGIKAAVGIAQNAEEGFTKFQKHQSQNRIDEYKSYLGAFGGLFDDKFNEVIKREEDFLKTFEKNIDLGLGKAFSDKAMIGQKTATSVSSTPEIKQFVEVDLKLPKDAMEKFDDAVFDSISTLKSYDKELIKLQRNSAKLARGRQTTGDEFSNELDRLIKKVITDPKKDESTKDFVSAVTDFGNGVTAYLAGIQALLEMPSQIIDAVTGIVDTFANLPTTLSSSISGLGESVGGFVSGGFGWRGKEEEKERRRAEQARLAELRTGLEAEWDDVIAVFDLSPLEESLYNLNKKYAEQAKLAAESGASIEKLNEARALEIASITQAALEASQAQFSGLYTGIEGLRRTAALDKSANPFSFLLDEFVDFEEQISLLNDSTEEQIKLQEKQVSTLSDMYSLAQ
ncbi:MAG: phage tail tape measure protein, partial [Bacteroidetes bacterium]|nr:phage tail tape measure protein [Bacteroidota bacterium]